MKEIKAYIKPHKMPIVVQALHKINGLTGMSINEVKGFGRSRAKSDREKVVIDTVDFNPQIKIEIVCHAVYISNIEDAIRIGTGERGEKAV